MSNFTKSIFYSTTVLAAGLVAIFAIYSNVTSQEDGAMLAEISPAAGESTLGVRFGDEAETAMSGMVNEATDAVLGAAETVGATINGAVEATEGTMAKTMDTAESTLEGLMPAAGDAETEEEAPAEDTAAEETTEEAPAEDAAAEETTEEAPAGDAAQ